MPDTKVFVGERPVLVGHRGFGSGVVDGHPENTLASFAAAAEAGLGWVEADVRRTLDEALVVVHHPTTPNRRFVVDQTAAEVTAQGALTFADLLAALPPELGLNVDVKTSLEDAVRPPETTTTGMLIPVLAAERARRRLLVTSFDPAALLHIRSELPDVPLGLITWAHFPLRKAVPAARHLGLDVVAAHRGSYAANQVDPAPVHRDTSYSIEVAHQAGLEVLAWCPAPEEAVQLAEAGADALTVNDVPGVQAALGRTGSREAAGEGAG